MCAGRDLRGIPDFDGESPIVGRSLSHFFIEMQNIDLIAMDQRDGLDPNGKFAARRKLRRVGRGNTDKGLGGALRQCSGEQGQTEEIAHSPHRSAMGSAGYSHSIVPGGLLVRS